MEITHSGPECKSEFHEKIGKVKHCIDNKAVMLFVNGIDAFDEPKYLYMDHNVLEKATKLSEAKHGIVYRYGKPHYKYKLSFFAKEDWRVLPSIKGIKLPEKYKQIYDLL